VLTVGEKYFSLEKEKCVVNGDLGLLVAKLNRNGTECLFVPLPRIAKGDAIQWANGAYLKFPAANNGFTCLDPIKLFTAKAYGWQTEGQLWCSICSICWRRVRCCVQHTSICIRGN
jgi:hypothetical protein